MELSFSSMIGVAIGLVVIYYILSLIVSSLTNQITKWMDLRAKDLWIGMRELIDKPDQLKKVMDNRLIKNLKTKRHGAPDTVVREAADKNKTKLVIPHVEDIPPKEFALALFDVVAPKELKGSTQSDLLASFKKQLDDFPDGNAKQAVLKFVNSGVESIQEARTLAETWFDDKMKRISALYTQETGRISFALAFVIAIALGIDSIAVTAHLWQEPSARALLAQEADRVVGEEGLEAGAEDLVGELQALNIPMFWWSDPPEDFAGWFVKVIGTILTGFATGLGAPFWYGILKQLRPGSSQQKSTA